MRTDATRMPLQTPILFSKLARTAAVVLLCVVLPAGCKPMDQNAQNTNPDDLPPGAPSPSGVIPPLIPTLPNGEVHIETSKPIPFDRHNFGSYCFDTYGCKVLYDNRYDSNDPDDELSSSSASLGADYPSVMRGGWLGIRNFPMPAEVTWRDKDGNPHQATVDIAAIFKDQVVVHEVPQDQLPQILTADIHPEVILEVNDRTIRVWTRAFVPTTVLQKPGNPNSNFRRDMIQVYSKTY
jgi:hypothetical protein